LARARRAAMRARYGYDQMRMSHRDAGFRPARFQAEPTPRLCNELISLQR
jgi:hypothetical protein